MFLSEFYNFSVVKNYSKWLPTLAFC
jgi:hypothetical protein